MKKQKPDFTRRTNRYDSYYDLREDWPLIEASLAKQYGIRIRNEKDMPWSEFCILVSGLMPDTPLGNIVSIRCEKDKKVLKSFSPEQRKIHTDWKLKISKIKSLDKESYEKDMERLSIMFKSMFGKGGQ